MSQLKLKILHLFPELLDQYFDNGNIKCMKKRLEWRGIDCEVFHHTSEDGAVKLSDMDIVLIGGGADKEQLYVCNSLLKQRDEIKSYIEDGGSILAICGGYQLLGSYYKLKDEKIDIVKWSEDPAEYIAASLSPSKVLSVEIDEESKSAAVKVPAYQLSLAIGKSGQNVRLAARLTGWKIDITAVEE